MASYSSFIIAEGTRPRMCASILREAGCPILGIISDDIGFQQWATKVQIPWYPAILPRAERIHLLSRQSFDYLFSIINHWVLLAQILTLPRKGAINYHDAPLPWLGLPEPGQLPGQLPGRSWSSR